MRDFLVILETFGQWMIPAAILLILVTAAVNRVPMYESFVTGAKEGFSIAISIIPYLVAMLLAIKVFDASGALADLMHGLARVMSTLGLQQYSESLELLPLALTKPLTGSGARAVMLELFDKHGTDSFLGLTASIMMGSTETTFYVLTVYYGAVQIKKVRHTLAACLWTDLAAVTAAIFMGYILYG
ncbi:MAG: spore maturation protein [Pirellulales bacterium]|nr:spore maturation protein [Pirellulales bacterium]